jgi:hypothetical protein
MSKKVIAILSGLIFCLSMFSQTKNDTITTTKISGGYKFELNNKVLTVPEMMNLIQTNPDALQYMQKAKSSGGVANVLAFAGGACIGWPVGRALAGGEFNWTMIGIGCGLVAVAIPIVNSANKNAKIAVDVYNQGIRKTSQNKNPIELKLGLNQNGVGLTMNF